MKFLSFISSPINARLIGLLLPHLWVNEISGQSPMPGGPTDIFTVRPTVTVETGDTGGKFFGGAPDSAKTRHYYIAAEPELWKFAPQGQDPICGKPLPTSLLMNRASWKVRYVQYTDDTFSARVLSPQRLGILGPVLRGIRGEYLAVTFLNRAWIPLSMHPHGVRYDKDSEGSYYKPGAGKGAAVAPGARFTYVWQLDEASAPRSQEPSSKAWLYHSHVAGDEEVNLGLLGFLVVGDPERCRTDGTPKDIDREMAALFTIFNETNPDEDSDGDPDDRPPNAPPPPHERSWAQLREAAELGERHSINGLVFGNLAGLDANVNERVRWYLFGVGSENDFHTAHWHGLRATTGENHVTDTIELLPGSMKVADMIADNPGSWLFHCHVAEHMKEGMFARFTVHSTDHPASSEPELAYFGTQETLRTLRIESAELHYNDKTHGDLELTIRAQATVPDPFPSARQPFSVRIGNHRTTFHPNLNGLDLSEEGVLVLKNSFRAGNGVVTGGKIEFDLTLKGPGWEDELRPFFARDKLKVMLEVQVGGTHLVGLEPRLVPERDPGS